MKKKIMIMAMAGLIAAGSTDAAWAAQRHTDERLMQLLGSIRDYISGQIKDEETSLPETADARVSQIVSLTNAERSKAGLAPLAASKELNRLARLKAEDMAEKNYFSHESPTYGSAFDMMKAEGITYRTAGENIARGQRNAQTVMNGWMKSSGHRANILGNQYCEIGVGVAENGNGTIYWVQIFKG